VGVDVVWPVSRTAESAYTSAANESARARITGMPGKESGMHHAARPLGIHSTRKTPGQLMLFGDNFPETLISL
jgi:hypothetical protein